MSRLGYQIRRRTKGRGAAKRRQGRFFGRGRPAAGSRRSVSVFTSLPGPGADTASPKRPGQALGLRASASMDSIEGGGRFSAGGGDGPTNSFGPLEREFERLRIGAGSGG